ADQLVGRVAHGRHDHAHLLAGASGLDDAAGHAPQPLDIGDRRSSIFLYDDGHVSARAYYGRARESRGAVVHGVEIKVRPPCVIPGVDPGATLSRMSLRLLLAPVALAALVAA